jgi:hypothetical protein
VYNVSDLMMRDIYEISGVNEYLRGATPEISRTATEATIIEGASNIKAQFKLRQVEKAARKVGELLLGFAADIFPQTDYDEVQLYLTGRDAEAVSRTVAPEDRMDAYGEPAEPGADIMMTPSPDMWEGEYEVFVEQSSTELRNPVLKEQKYRAITMDLIGIAPMLAEQGTMLDMRKLVTIWLEAAGIEDVDGLFSQAGPPALDPGELNVDVRADDDIGPELLEQLLGVASPGLETGEAPADAILPGGPDTLEAPPDVSMGPFDETNTGILPTSY